MYCIISPVLVRVKSSWLTAITEADPESLANAYQLAIRGHGSYLVYRLHDLNGCNAFWCQGYHMPVLAVLFRHALLFTFAVCNRSAR